MTSINLQGLPENARIGDLNALESTIRDFPDKVAFKLKYPSKSKGFAEELIDELNNGGKNARSTENHKG